MRLAYIPIPDSLAGSFFSSGSSDHRCFRQQQHGYRREAGNSTASTGAGAEKRLTVRAE